MLSQGIDGYKFYNNRLEGKYKMITENNIRYKILVTHVFHFKEPSFRSNKTRTPFNLDRTYIIGKIVKPMYKLIKI